MYKSVVQVGLLQDLCSASVTYPNLKGVLKTKNNPPLQRFCKRLDLSTDSEVLKEAVLSAARETSCPKCVRKRE